MSAEIAAPSKPSAFAVLRDTIVAPGSAFEVLRERPVWLVAFLVTSAVAMVAAVLQIPAGEHMASSTVQQQIAHDPNMAGMSPERQQRVVQIATAVQRWLWVAFPIFIIVGNLITAVVLLIGNAIGRGSASFRSLFALAANVAIVQWGIGYLFLAILTRIRGPESFSSTSDLELLWPSLAWLVPGAGPKVVALLSAFNVFSLWSLVLLGFGLEKIGRVPRLVAFGTPLVLLLVFSAWGASFAK